MALREFLLPTSPELEAVLDNSEFPPRQYSGTGAFFEPREFGERDVVDLRNTLQPGLTDYRYRLLAIEAPTSGSPPRDAIEILPVAKEGLFLTLRYLPSLDLDQVEGDVYYADCKGIAEEWLILDVLGTVQAKTKDEQAYWAARKQEIEAQLRQSATDRDAAQPAEIRRVAHRTDPRAQRTGGPWWRNRRP